MTLYSSQQDILLSAVPVNDPLTIVYPTCIDSYGQFAISLPRDLLKVQVPALGYPGKASDPQRREHLHIVDEQLTCGKVGDRAVGGHAILAASKEIQHIVFQFELDCRRALSNYDARRNQTNEAPNRLKLLRRFAVQRRDAARRFREVRLDRTRHDGKRRLYRILQRDEVLRSDVVFQCGHDDLLRGLQDRRVLRDLLLYDLLDLTMRGIIRFDRFDAVLHRGVLSDLFADQRRSRITQHDARARRVVQRNGQFRQHIRFFRAERATGYGHFIEELERLYVRVRVVQVDR